MKKKLKRDKKEKIRKDILKYNKNKSKWKS